jgi:uncharacterized membrane protein (UPF0127 family)
VSPTRRAAVVVAGAILGIVVVGVLAWRALGDDPGTTNRPVTDVVGARGPFRGLTAGSIRVGDRDLSVVVADSEAERTRGLRGRPDARPYDGMLFVFPSATSTAFTMAGVPDALAIAFFDGDGRRVDTQRMEPCTGTDATCPTYRAPDEYRYALETAPGAMPAGALALVGTR